MEPKRILSAIQPTGMMHLGNYFGAIQNWANLQSTYHCTYGVVNYHSMTMPYQATQLREQTWDMVFQLLACGIKTENVFIQSLIPEHAELAWILSCVCSYGELSRMTQFKDKSDQLHETNKDAFISTGLFSYPVLQAADILIYRADFVPIGKDQEQHLELTRNIAERFNRSFDKEYFTPPQPLFTEVPKLMSLADPLKKMSKSLGDKHCIFLFEEETRIRKKIQSAVTDTGVAGSISPGVANLLLLIKACGGSDLASQLTKQAESGTLKYSELKQQVADQVCLVVKPIQETYQDIRNRKKEFKEQIKASSAQIRQRAQVTLKEVRELTGLI